MVQRVQWNTTEVVDKPARRANGALAGACQLHGFHDFA